MRSKTGSALLFLGLFVLGCGDDAATDDGENESDAGSLDASVSLDGGGAKQDGGASDASSAQDGSAADQDASDGADASTSDASGSDAAAGDAATGDAAVAATTFTRVYEIITAKCKSCHIDRSSGNMSLKTKSDAYDALVNVAAKGKCAPSNRQRVIPNNADDSLLIRKLEGGPNLCGERMPLNGPYLTDEIKEIRSWISAGAKND